MEKKRVLIVEDHEDLRKQYAQIIQRLDVEVDAVGSRDEAYDRLRNKTYHVALVDVMLTNQRNDRGGMDVMERIRQLDEGTEIVVLSGAEEVDVPVDSLQKYRARRYIMKQHAKTPQDISEPVHEVLTTSLGLKEYGRYRSLIDYLAIGVGERFWVDRALRTLKPMEGWSGLNAFVDLFVGPFAPLLPRKGARELSRFDDSAGLLVTNLWSKAVGAEVVLFARSGMRDTEAQPVPDRPAELLRSYRKALVDGWAYRLSGADRAAFADSLYEV